MSMTDPVADMLTRIRNGNSIYRKDVEMPASRLRVGIAQVLKDEGFIVGYEVKEGTPFSTLTLELKYGEDGEKVIRSIDRVSKPGRRVYVGLATIPKVRNGLGVAILSTPKGVMSDRAAREASVGGEVLCEVW